MLLLLLLLLRRGGGGSRRRNRRAGRRQLRSRLASRPRLSASATGRRIWAPRRSFIRSRQTRRMAASLGNTAATTTAAAATTTTAAAAAESESAAGGAGRLLGPSASLRIRHSRSDDLGGGKIADAGVAGKAVDRRRGAMRPRRYQRLRRQESEGTVVTGGRRGGLVETIVSVGLDAGGERPARRPESPVFPFRRFVLLLCVGIAQVT